MKTLLLDFIAGLIVLSGCAGDNIYSHGESTSKAGFLLETSLAEEPETVMSYRIIPPEVTIDSVVELGAKLGFTGEAGFISNGEVIVMSKPEESVFLRVYVNSGAIEYSTPNAYPLSPKLPSDEEAVTIATEFLKQVGLWHSDIDAEAPVVGGSYGGETSHLVVGFTRTVDLIPLTGPGNKMAIRVGDGGEVVRALMYYPELTPDREVRCIPQAQAFDRLKSGEIYLSIPMDCETVVIDDISLGYYLEVIRDKQELLMPVYIFKGQYRDAKDTVLEQFTGWVDAVEK